MFAAFSTDQVLSEIVVVCVFLNEVRSRVVVCDRSFLFLLYFSRCLVFVAPPSVFPSL